MSITFTNEYMFWILIFQYVDTKYSSGKEEYLFVSQHRYDQ